MVAGLIVALWIDEWFAPWYPFWLLTCGALMIAASRELVNLLSSTTLRPSANSVFGGVLALLIANWVPHLALDVDIHDGLPALRYDPARPQAALGYIFLCFVAVIMVSFVVQSLQFEKPGRATLRIAGTIFVLGYVGLLGSFIVQLRWFEGKHEGLIALLFLVAAAKGADTGAYTVGRLCGRHKLWPALSPHKTIEGAVGGLVFAVGASLARRGDRPLRARNAGAQLGQSRPVRAVHRRCGPGRRLDGVDDQARLRAEGRVRLGPRVRRHSRRRRLADLRGPGRVYFLASLRALRRRLSRICIHEVKPDIEQQQRDDDELECDLKSQRLEMIERFLERIEDRFNHFDTLVDLGPEAIEAQVPAEPAIDCGGGRRRQVAARICKRPFDCG